MWVIIVPPIHLGVWSTAVAAFCIIVCVIVPAPKCHNYV